jgi:hypothetical protein
MKYERQKRVSQELDTRIPRAYGRSERSLAQNLLRAGVNARRLHGEPLEQAIDEAVAQLRGLFPGFVPNILPAP